jgi:hypothetical protein
VGQGHQRRFRGDRAPSQVRLCILRAEAKAEVGKQDYSASVADFNEAIRLIELRGGLQIYLTEEQPPESYIDSYRTRGV